MFPQGCEQILQAHFGPSLRNQFSQSIGVAEDSKGPGDVTELNRAIACLESYDKLEW